MSVNVLLDDGRAMIVGELDGSVNVSRINDDVLLSLLLMVRLCPLVLVAWLDVVLVRRLA